MAIHPGDPESYPLPCTWHPVEGCADCAAQGQLMCRLDMRDLRVFIGLFLPFAIAAVAGVVRAGFGHFLWLWLAFALFFFFVWEAYILCRHCPYWAEDSIVLHCHANYGVYKLFKYTRKPMSRWEQAHFLIGVLLLLGIPIPFMLIGEEYIIAALSLALASYFMIGLKTRVCSRCINFSCPLNGVPKPYVDLYLQRNPLMLQAWQASGYVLGETSKYNQ